MSDGRSACRLCRDHVFIGESLVKRDALAILESGNNEMERGLREPIFDRYQLVFPENDPETVLNSGKLLKYWKLKINDQKGVNGAAFRFFNGYVPVYRPEDLNDPRFLKSEEDNRSAEPMIKDTLKTMNHISAAALTIDANQRLIGLDALGVLKADVDHLGVLMACGLPENLYSISRLATMSRQLNNFFTVFLPWFLGKQYGIPRCLYDLRRRR